MWSLHIHIQCMWSLHIHTLQWKKSDLLLLQQILKEQSFSCAILKCTKSGLHKFGSALIDEPAHIYHWPQWCHFPELGDGWISSDAVVLLEDVRNPSLHSWMQSYRLALLHLLLCVKTTNVLARSAHFLWEYFWSPAESASNGGRLERAFLKMGGRGGNRQLHQIPDPFPRWCISALDCSAMLKVVSLKLVMQL